MTNDLPAAFLSAERLEQHLGNPLEEQCAGSFARAIDCDERDIYPRDFVDVLGIYGFLHHFVPKNMGGRLTSFDEAGLVLRVISRRDLTAAVALGQSFLGTIALWIAGSDQQKKRAADLLLNSKHTALALTEEEHGSDILASDVTATVANGGFILTGQKWLINNGTLATALTVFARTKKEGGFGGFSLFFVDKELLPNGSFSCTPKNYTHGIRGADISGISFHDAFVSHDSVIGAVGRGLELTIKSLQITRIGCANFSIGAADTAIRTAMRFARCRSLYGVTVFDIPYPQSILTNAFVDLLICDAVTMIAMRMSHVAPSQLSVVSAAVKYFVPTTVEKIIHDCSVVFGARHYLREGLGAGIFQKMMRDAAVISVFDGSTSVNLDSIAHQLRLLMQTKVRQSDIAPVLSVVCDLNAKLPDFDPGGLAVVNSGREYLTQGLCYARQMIEEYESTPVRHELLVLLAELMAHVDQQEQTLCSHDTGPKPLQRRVIMMKLAKRFSAIFAAACCVHLWIHSHRYAAQPFLREGYWVILALHRLLETFDANRTLNEHSLSWHATAELTRLFDNNQTFTLVPLSLSARPT